MGDKDLLWAHISGSVDVPITNTKLSLNAVFDELSRGSKFTLDDGGIKIGAGIRSIRVSGQVYWTGSISGARLRTRVYKNSGTPAIVYNIQNSTTGYYVQTLPTITIPVEEGDHIYVYTNPNSVATISGSSVDPYTTFLAVAED